MDTLRFIGLAIILTMMTAVFLYAAARLVFTAWFRSKQDFYRSQHKEK